jgi:hypothetical protein
MLYSLSAPPINTGDPRAAKLRRLGATALLVLRRTGTCHPYTRATPRQDPKETERLGRARGLSPGNSDTQGWRV